MISDISRSLAQGVLIAAALVVLLAGPASFIANKTVSRGVGTVTSHLTAGQGVVDGIFKDANDTNVAIMSVDLRKVCTPLATARARPDPIPSSNHSPGLLIRMCSSPAIGSRVVLQSAPGSVAMVLLLCMCGDPPPPWVARHRYERGFVL